jgi:hypothetical protein
MPSGEPPTPQSAAKDSQTTRADTVPVAYDWNQIVDDLNRLLRLRTTPIGMKLFTEMDPKIQTTG